MSRLHRIVIDPEGVVALLHFANDKRAVDHRLETANRSAFIEGKHIHRFDRLRLAVDVALCDGDLRAHATDVGGNHDAGERDRRGVLRD